VEDIKQSTVECVREKEECASNITKKSVYVRWCPNVHILYKSLVIKRVLV
jgi:hypothetical protein